MPAIFTQEHRDELYLRMIAAGWDALVSGGVRAPRVEEIAQAAGIAKGTFYHFFASKSDFIYAMLMENRQHAVDELEDERLRVGRPLTRVELRAWLVRIWRSKRNIFRIATADDYAYLSRGFPEGRILNPAVDDALVDWLVDEVVASGPRADRLAAVNLLRTLALTLLNRGLLHEEALEHTVDALIDDALDALFG